ncbi:MAG: tRNA (adenosine(37)-N6)-threonylcarbamoyltransferase complex transferase subunit TsaD [Phycisphaerales bacterium]|nr:tRNA (adenosine(37)-N6)-threonylcarbamoyltransferase complex transferase subunit TsaD [Phycisphaerales bacterium]
MVVAAAAAHTQFVSTLILGIETSCDETAAAVVADGADVRSNVVHSQIALHARWRGVVPEVASRSHTERILPIVEQALADAGVFPADLTAVAVTHRPGMVGCLLVGMAAAKALAWRHGLPLLGVDHVQAHVHTGLLADPTMSLPALSLVASGGHTALYLLTEPGTSVRLGTTRDDAAGEALDKGASLLGLPYPGGPSIEQAAAAGRRDAVDLPRTLLGADSLDFSFSGLKSALLYTLKPQQSTAPAEKPEGRRLADLAASYQEAVVDVLIAKLRRAAERHPVQSLCIGGGVARNLRLRERLAQDPVLRALRLVLPPLALCSDNGAMIAGLAHIRWRKGERDPLELDAIATPQAGGKVQMR